MKNVSQFLSEVRTEMAKVVWPSYEELVGSTIVVLILVCLFSLYLWAIDFSLAMVTSKIFSLYGVR